MSLSVSSLSLTRGGKRIISELSFMVQPGEALLLKGPNGVGKSTLLRALCGLLPVVSGRIKLGDISLTDQDLWAEQIVYAGHLDALKSQLTVAENIAFWAGLFGGDAEAALASFQLQHIADRPVFTCSAGQKRRAGLARLACSVNRPLWLLDEPTVSLDTETIKTVTQQIRAHLERGGMALIATHIDLPVTARSLTLCQITDDQDNDDPFLQGPLT